MTALDTLTIATGLAVALGAGLLSGLSGFGAGLMLSAYMTPILGAKLTIPALAVATALTNAGRLWSFQGGVDARIAMLVLAGSMPGAWLGAALLAEMSDVAADLVLAAFLILSVPLRRLIARRTARLPSLAVGLGAATVGAASGITTGAGILILPLLLAAGLAGPALLATDAVVSLILNLGRSAAFGSVGLIDGVLLSFGIALGIATIPGSRIAAWIVRRTDIRVHTLFLEALVVAAGLFVGGRTLFRLV